MCGVIELIARGTTLTTRTRNNKYNSNSNTNSSNDNNNGLIEQQQQPKKTRKNFMGTAATTPLASSSAAVVITSSATAKDDEETLIDDCWEEFKMNMKALELCDYENHPSIGGVFQFCKSTLITIGDMCYITALRSVLPRCHQGVNARTNCCIPLMKKFPAPTKSIELIVSLGG